MNAWISHLQINVVWYLTQPQESVRLAALRNDEMALLSGQMALPSEHCVAKILPLYTSSKLNLRDRGLVEVENHIALLLCQVKETRAG